MLKTFIWKYSWAISYYVAIKPSITLYTSVPRFSKFLAKYLRQLPSCAPLHCYKISLKLKFWVIGTVAWNIATSRLPFVDVWTAAYLSQIRWTYLITFCWNFGVSNKQHKRHHSVIFLSRWEAQRSPSAFWFLIQFFLHGLTLILHSLTVNKIQFVLSVFLYWSE